MSTFSYGALAVLINFVWATELVTRFFKWFSGDPDKRPESKTESIFKGYSHEIGEDYRWLYDMKYVISSVALLDEDSIYSVGLLAKFYTTIAECFR
jgi:hypothetical protein